MRRRGRVAVLAAVLASSACSASEGGTSSSRHRDTLHPTEESLRRFRAGLPQATKLYPSFKSLEDVARAYVTALATNDRAAIAGTLMSRAEFAWLYYPESHISRPPYELPVGIAWFELEGNSLAGVRRALSSYGGRRIALRALECESRPVVHGENRLWNGCIVTLTLDDGRPARLRLFGSILERHGAFKLASAANDL
jgi:hypothetical protein